MIRISAAAALMVLALALAGCGSRQDLELVEGQTPPPAPYGKEDPETAAELLQPDPEAVPGRNVELRRQSEEREDDPFDLPPEG